MNSNRYGISIYSKILLDSSATVVAQRAALLELERLVKAEKEYMDRPKTASECVGYIPPRPTPAHDDYVVKLRLLQAQCNDRLSAADRLAAYDELQTLMYHEKYKFERAADEEHKKVMLTRAASVTEIETCLEAFLLERKFQRSKCSMHYNLGSEDEDRAFSTQFRNSLRKYLKLPPV